MGKLRGSPKLNCNDMSSQLAIKLNEFYFPSKVWHTIWFPKYAKLFATITRSEPFVSPGPPCHAPNPE